VPAYISDATQMFVPPSKIISFNIQLRENDGLLANFISKKINCTYAEALAAIEGTVSLWRDTLNEDNPLKIEEIGRFYYDKEKNLQFKPKVDANFDLVTYGLPVFRAPILESESTFQRMNREREIFVSNTTSNRRGIFRMAAVFVAVIGLLAIGTLKSDLYQQEQFNFANIFSAVFDSNSTSQKEIESEPVDDTDVVMPSVEQEVEEASIVSEKAQPISENSNLEEVGNSEVEVEKLEIGVDESQLPFQIVVGSFSNKENALSFVDQLKNQGHQAYILQGKGLLKVSSGGYSNRTDATKAASYVKTSIQPGAWIFNQ
jgi:cell division septation protein DedD